MRALSIVSLLLVGVGCGVKVPHHPGLPVSIDATIRADARVRSEARIQIAVPLEGSAVVEFFGIPLEGAQDVVFVLDRSGSMSQPAQGGVARLGAGPAPQPQPEPGATEPPPAAPRKIDVAHAELVDALERLPAGTRMNVLFFNSTLEAYAPGLAPLQDADREGLVGFVQDTVPLGSTALAPAMRTAFLMNARRIVLLSDGLGNVGGDAQSLLRDAREAMRGGVRIDTIGLGKDQDASLLRALATESGGIYQDL